MAKIETVNQTKKIGEKKDEIWAKSVVIYVSLRQSMKN